MFGDFPLAQKIVVVTGGGSGTSSSTSTKSIGLLLTVYPGISLAFIHLALSRSAKILIADIQLSKEAEDLVNTQDEVHFQKCDVRNWKDLKALIQTSVLIWNDVPDVYIAGAGIFEPVRLPDSIN